jgi:hypothetical protein
LFAVTSLPPTQSVLRYDANNWPLLRGSVENDGPRRPDRGKLIDSTFQPMTDSLRNAAEIRRLP